MYQQNPAEYARNRAAEMYEWAARNDPDGTKDLRRVADQELDAELSLFQRYRDNEAGFQRFLKKLRELDQVIAPSWKRQPVELGHGSTTDTPSDWDQIFEALRKRKRYQLVNGLLTSTPGRTL